MLRKIRKLSLEKQLFLSFMAVSFLLLSLSLSITLSFSLTRQRKEIDKNISGVAAYIASMEPVADMLDAGYPDTEVTKELDALSENFPDINLIMVCDSEGLRFYHTNRQTTGETFVEGEEMAILAGSRPYITIGYGTKGTQRRAFHAIKRDGTITGYVMASVFTAYISDQEKALFLPYLLILLLMMFVSVLFSHGIVLVLRSSLMGHHPQELLDLYLRQDEVLNAIEEGLVASGREGTILFSNLAAREMFGGDDFVQGENLAEYFPDFTPFGPSDLQTPVYHKSVVLRDRRLLVSRIPIKNATDVQGILTILNDKTEMEKLSDELSGTKYMLDTLRAFNHEFLNKLHVILGYLQTGETKKAITFIMNSNLVSSQAIRQTADCIRVSRICALVIGKMMHAAELGILLSVSPDSFCKEDDILLTQDDAVTVIGNLLENAIEELSCAASQSMEITLGLYCSPDCNIITCEDTGRGIPTELLPQILERGVSSKGNGRGTGLFLVNRITAEYGGEIQIDTEAGEGTIFTLTFTRKPKQ